MSEVWKKIQDAAGGALDPMEARAARGNEIFRPAPAPAESEAWKNAPNLGSQLTSDEAQALFEQRQRANALRLQAELEAQALNKASQIADQGYKRRR